MKVKHIDEDQFIHAMSGTARQVRLVFDIETAPLPDSALALTYDSSDLKLPDPPGAFDPQSVKYGRMTDPKKRAAKLQECVNAHNAALSAYPHECARIQDEHWAKFKEKAALDAMTGRVVAIGYAMPTGPDCKVFLHYGTEEDLLANFWETVTSPCLKSAAGHNIAGFDLPFLIKRSWIHQMTPPPCINQYGRVEPPFKDTMTTWQCGNRGSFAKLDRIAAAMGIPGKLDGVTGDQFAQLLEDDKETADKYLTADVVATLRVAQRMRAL